MPVVPTVPVASDAPSACGEDLLSQLLMVLIVMELHDLLLRRLLAEIVVKLQDLLPQLLVVVVQLIMVMVLVAVPLGVLPVMPLVVLLLWHSKAMTIQIMEIPFPHSDPPILWVFILVVIFSGIQ